MTQDGQTVRIGRLGHLGDGVAAGPIFVPGALPGEEVAGVVTDGVMAQPRIIEPSTDRVSAPCRHARSCGGCQVQHASDGFVAAWKQDVVRAALAAHGLEIDLPPVAVSPQQSRRRATFSARRTKKGALAGFHQKRSDVIVGVSSCQVVTPVLAAALPMVEELAALGASRKAEMSVCVTETLTGLDVDARGGKPVDPQLRSDLADLARAHDLARVTWSGESLTRRKPEVAFGTVTVSPPPGAFLQATLDGQDTLINAVRTTLKGCRAVADLFAGCGTFALPLARDMRVHAAEGDAALTEALLQGWRQASGLKQVTAEARDLFRNPLLPDEMAKLDGVVLDPPRAGAEAQVAQIARARVPRIAYVSCNPVSFARDAAYLVAAGYRLDHVQVVDQFRWSAHVELVSALSLPE